MDPKELIEAQRSKDTLMEQIKLIENNLAEMRARVVLLKGNQEDCDDSADQVVDCFDAEAMARVRVQQQVVDLRNKIQVLNRTKIPLLNEVLNLDKFINSIEPIMLATPSKHVKFGGYYTKTIPSRQEEQVERTFKPEDFINLW